MSGPISSNPFVGRDNAQAVYILGRIAKRLGLDANVYAPSPTNMRSSVDWDRMVTDMTDRIDRMAQAALEAESRLPEVERERDEAKAEVRAMLEGRREEEERARMRLLEKVFAAEMSITGVPKTNLLPAMMALNRAEKTVTLKDLRTALLADLDALVALGLRGEVVS